MSDGLHRLGVTGQRVVVLGLAVTGRVSAKVLASAGASVLASDLRGDVAEDVVRDLRDAGVDVETGSHDRATAALDTADFVLPSPGIPPRALLLATARGVPIVSELDLGQRLTDARVVGVTGTKGKSTVCRLALRFVRAAGLDAYACGNNEVPFIEAVVAHPHADVFVVEASSFRLNWSKSFHPHAAVFTNFAPDHLDWHDTMDDYFAAKARIAANQTADDVYVFPGAQPELADVAHDSRRVPFGSPGGAWVDKDDIVVAFGDTEVRASGVDALAKRGSHFALDAAAAATAAVFCGADAGAIQRGLDGFVPDHHRLELVGELGGVRFYDDSTATNPFAAVAAIRASSNGKRVVLIAGGRKKVPDLLPLRDEARLLRAVVAIGEAAGDVASAFEGTGVPVCRAASMREAVQLAAAQAQPGDAVLLAPACASQDAYTDYAERGCDFQDACRSLGVGM